MKAFRYAFRLKARRIAGSLKPGVRFPSKFALVMMLIGLVFSQSAKACTIFVLTDAARTLFCNNEDFSNPRTRIWFVPGGKGYLGCVYVGYDDGVEQGGMNTKGLAFDAVTGYKESWKDDHRLAVARGNPMARMLETCSTVSEAISFFRSHRFPWFAQLKLLVADRTGRSVILGASQGELKAEEADRCRGLGFGESVLDKMLKVPPTPTIENGITILRACVQKGEDPTQYSNVFDLKSGDIFLYPAGGPAEGVHFNLSSELQKGAHYFNMPTIGDEVRQSPRPLLDNMKRLLIDRYKPIPDREPSVTSHIRKIIRDTLASRSAAGDYTAEYWNQIKPNGFSSIVDERGSNNQDPPLTLVGRSQSRGLTSYRYRVGFSDATLLMRFTFAGDRLCAIELEGMQLVYS